MTLGEPRDGHQTTRDDNARHESGKIGWTVETTGYSDSYRQRVKRERENNTQGSTRQLCSLNVQCTTDELNLGWGDDAPPIRCIALLTEVQCRH